MTGRPKLLRRARGSRTPQASGPLTVALRCLPSRDRERTVSMRLELDQKTSRQHELACAKIGVPHAAIAAAAGGLRLRQVVRSSRGARIARSEERTSEL